MTETSAALDLLTAIRAALLPVAGDEFTWAHPDAPRTIDSAHRQGLVILMTEAQEGLCAACGDPLAGERADLCHLIPSRVSGRGLAVGNAYVGHTSCNSDDSKLYGDAPVPLHSLARPDLVLTAWPTRSACVAASAEVRKVREARRAARLARS